MATTLTISQKELQRQAAAALEGKAYEVFLAFNGTTGLTAESTYALWQDEEITGDASYVPVTGTIATGAYDAGDARYETPVITATFSAAAAGTGYTYVTKKNRRNDPDRITLKKYDPVVRKHVEFREER